MLYPCSQIIQFKFFTLLPGSLLPNKVFFFQSNRILSKWIVISTHKVLRLLVIQHKTPDRGIPGWRSGLAPAFGPGRDPGDLGSNPTSGSRCLEPASPSACVSASLSLSLSPCDYHE